MAAGAGRNLGQQSQYQIGHSLQLLPVPSYQDYFFPSLLIQLVRMSSLRTKFNC